jgi:outer membrane protein assembly factor BamE (lipoprotein component of BamABCDE complex)
MSQRKESWAFYADEVTDHKILAFHFDEKGLLKDVQTYNKDELKEISYRDKVTPTSGRTLSIFEQLFGNFGKIGG